ncbi:hypothetical protein CICLE_v10004503mg [Citrus x clementina]|uniref:TROVE domain-containing protein n=1 Tax=Citrus clementina TaxID=85681 RepID=V4RG54_CITCL|nr:uncharacterized protein LOC18032527 [Citrus x clementina]ESR32868.1 hypothetical protein CICLE_v10004503mg [Citrus x clementina]
MALLGPPELRNSNPQQQSKQSDPTAAISDPFMNLMAANFNKTAMATPTPPPMGFTENGSGTFLSSGNPCLDFFFHVVPSTPPQTLTGFLNASWAHNPLTTLKLICNLRGVRGTGKSDKEGFYTAALWLHSLHPKTFACNVALFAEFGYFKDLPEIIYRLLEGSDVRQIQKAEWERRKRGGSGIVKKRIYSRRGRKFRMIMSRSRNCKQQPKRRNKKPAMADTRELRVANAMQRNKLEKERASALRKEKKIDTAKKVIARYSSDPDFRFLYDRVSDHFAECLKNDMKLYESGEVTKISLAAKWCPSIDSSFDRATLICESIARKVFPKTLYTEYEGIEDAHYAYRVRDRLRKQVLVPLRKALELPEVYIGANRWDSLPYNRVASVAMKLYKDKFLMHDPERFKKYLEDVKAGKAKIAAGALLPHEIIGSLDDPFDGGQVAELQWQRIVDDLMQKGKLRNCMAICDVSGSMHGTPMEVSVALGVLVSELSEEPWKGKLITFSENPELQVLEGDSLRSRTDFVTEMEWGMNTDFQKVFDLILQVAVNGNLKPEQMIKRLFVFSDMEFDQASANPWETDYQVIVSKYKEKGYGSVVPEIVFWNLRDSRSTPVLGTQKGVALVSGFSKNMLTLFLDNEGVINPEQVMEAAISGQEYQKLVVLD